MGTAVNWEARGEDMRECNTGSNAAIAITTNVGGWSCTPHVAWTKKRTKVMKAAWANAGK